MYCRSCKTHFRVPAGEEGDHGCPRCDGPDYVGPPVLCCECDEEAVGYYEGKPYCAVSFAKLPRDCRARKAGPP